MESVRSTINIKATHTKDVLKVFIAHHYLRFR